MAHRTCDRAGCNKPHRARGLCASHYNQTHAPNRHKKKLVKCAACGAEIMRSSGGGRVLGNACSSECKAKIAAMLRGERTELPAGHWARWYGATSEWPRYGFAECAWCGDPFVMLSSNHACCSRTCMWRRGKGVTRSAIDRAAEVRSCVRCGQSYCHAIANRRHCSDMCRDLDAEDRGAFLYRGWIRPAIRAAIYERDAYTCKLCSEPVDMKADPQRGDWAPTLDHIVPRSKGGTHETSNLRTAHRWCNSVRRDQDDSPLFEATA